jgi:hypothetical protein
MNRRWFLKGLAGAGAAVAISDELIEALKPKSTIFLPPKSGWLMPPLRMREVVAYDINNDAMPLRYDAAWILFDGTREQFHMKFQPERFFEWDKHPEILEHNRALARERLTQIMIERGGVKQADLKLPTGLDHAAIV